MSNCHYCANRDKVPNIPSHGPCKVCSTATCGKPSGRTDNYFHGEKCKCDCGVFVCEFDINPHMDGAHDGQDPESCFPDILGSNGVSTFGGAAAALAEGRHARFLESVEIAGFTDWLNIVRPGRAALAQALGKSWEGPEGRVIELAQQPPFGSWVAFTHEFYTQGTLERVLALSGYSLGRLAASAAQPGTATSDAWGSRAALTRWAAGGEVPDHEDLAPFLPRGATQEGLDTVRSALATTHPPAAAEVARWLVETVSNELEYV